MPDDCLSSQDLKEVRACLRGKIGRIHAASQRFHQGVRDSIIDAETAAIDFKFVELGAILKELAKANQSSIGKFLCDLFISIAIGPILGTVVGQLVSGPLTNIVAVRTGLDKLYTGLLQKVARPAPLSAEKIESIVQVGVDRISSSKYSLVTSRLNDVATGVVVDSFELMFDKIGHAGGASRDVYSPVTSKISFAAATVDYVPTTLEFVRSQARTYYEQQERIDDIVRFCLEWFIENTENRDVLAKLQASLDEYEQRFAEYRAVETSARREIRNLTKMVLVMLYYGDPKNWAKDDPVIRRGDDFDKNKYPGDPDTRWNFRPGTHFLEYDITLPEDLKKILISNILVPGRNKSFLAVMTAAKQKAMQRTDGKGLDFKRGFTDKEPDSLDAYIGNVASEWFTAEETAFWFFRKKMMSIYGELTSKSYDNHFMTMLQQRNLLTPSKPT